MAATALTVHTVTKAGIAPVSQAAAARRPGWR